jgi:hypothetical protein
MVPAVAGQNGSPVGMGSERRWGEVDVRNRSATPVGWSLQNTMHLSQHCHPGYTKVTMGSTISWLPREKLPFGSRYVQWINTCL